ncbi:MAG TPA: hypothetical protein PKD85_08780 [Saprospiraceae bacterium]|nr:hypothetical protein [Saprospiraceae bacterium]
MKKKLEKLESNKITINDFGNNTNLLNICGGDASYREEATYVWKAVKSDRTMYDMCMNVPDYWAKV